MKYYSDVLKKVFDTVEECNTAELEYQTKIKAEEDKKTAISNEKKKMAKDIECAEAEVEKAYSELKLAREDAKKIYQEARLEAEELIVPAEEKLKSAKRKHYETIKAFTEKYGSYNKVITGKDAAETFASYCDTFDELLAQLFNRF